ncbi:MAG: hypothetical protein HY263_04160 [Chloroflexi bacterium]|nr:hypothetical protein [Chloroflexota bacterium]
MSRRVSVVAVVAFVTAACGAVTPSTTPASVEPGVPAQAEATDGAFRLWFDLPRTIWRSTEPITGTAVLDFLGVGQRLLYGPNAGLIGFTWTQVGGTKHGTWVWQLDCSHHAISAAAPLSSPLRLMVAFTPDDPDASFYASTDFEHPLLPPGDYVLGAVASFSEVPCTGESAPPGASDHDMATSTITIHVIP